MHVGLACISCLLQLHGPKKEKKHISDCSISCYYIAFSAILENKIVCKLYTRVLLNPNIMILMQKVIFISPTFNICRKISRKFEKLSKMSFSQLFLPLWKFKKFLSLIFESFLQLQLIINQFQLTE